MSPKPSSDTPVPETPTTPLLDQTAGLALAPALQRRLNHVALVKRLRRNLTVGVASFTAVAALGFGLPAYANTLDVEQEPTEQVQTLTIAATAPLAHAVVRDDYTVVVPPPLQYPLLTGTGITSGFGMRGGRMHQGADIFPGAGTPIHAMAAGVVTGASGSGAYGNHVILQHLIDGQVVTSLYAHMAPGSMTVSVGDQVAVGDVLGAVGSTGNAQGAHLHFEIHPGGGGAVNPYPWIAARL